MGIDSEIAFRYRHENSASGNDDNDVNDAKGDDGDKELDDTSTRKAVAGYFLKTRGVKPFCGRHVKIQAEIADTGTKRSDREGSRGNQDISGNRRNWD